MKKFLKISTIFVFLFFNIQIFGQIYLPGFNNSFEMYMLSDLMHPIGWDEVWGEFPCCCNCGSSNPPTIPKYLSILTYNIHGFDGILYQYQHATVIKGSNVEVASVQEIWTRPLFLNLKAETQMKGRMVTTREGGVLGTGLYGHGILWRNTIVGNPTITKVKIHRSSESDDGDPKRAYIIAEFNDFCVIATHYSTYAPDRVVMTNSILNHSKVQMCFNKGKPVYIAGDLNETFNCPQGTNYHNDPNYSIKPLKNSGFEVLNDYNNPNVCMRDLILEKNTNFYKEIIERGVPNCADPTISDHLPYRVKVIYKKVHNNY